MDGVNEIDIFGSAMIRGQGDDAKPELPVVWVHGWGMSSAIWHAVPVFAAGPALALDLPGHGGRPWDAGLGADVGLWAEDLLARAPERAVWVGWSLGGLLALEVARRAPRRVARLILLAATPRFVAVGESSCGMAPDTLEQFMAGLVQDRTLTLQRFFALQAVGVEGAREVRARLGQAVAKSPPAAEAALRAGLAILRDTDLSASLGGLELSVQVLLGERDRIVPPCVAEIYRQALPRAEIHIQAGAGHAPFLHAPGLLGRWLDQR
ncbi:MAG: alpha/beta fold hydrolase [Halothiobacillaceae bacterium]